LVFVEVDRPNTLEMGIADGIPCGQVRVLAVILGVATLVARTAWSEPTITTQPASQLIYGGSNVMFRVEVSGVGPFTYQWQRYGTNLPRAIITTLAGNGIAGYSSDGGVANFTQISGPYGVATDAEGNVWFADANNNRVRKVDTNGIISTVAGNGTNGFSGDGASATNASLSYPTGLTLDATGNLYISDYENHRVRKVDHAGIITTFAGGGTNSGDGILATNAVLYLPIGLTFDASGNLVITDGGSDLIRKVDTTDIITTVQGVEAVYPTGVAMDSRGNLYVAACNNNRVVKVDTNGVTSVFAGTGSNVDSGDGGPAIDAGTSYPRGVDVDDANNVFIAAFYDNRVRVVDTNSVINAVAGTGAYGFSGDNGDALKATFQNLQGIALGASGNIFVTDYFNNRVREVAYSGPQLVFRSVTTNDTGDYRVIVSDSSGSVTSDVATLTVVLPPAIVAQPTAQSVLVSSNVTFTVIADGTSPLHYHWQLNGANLTGATNSNYSIGSVATNDAGDYSVIITNNYGSVTSSVAKLTVVVIPPGISTQPASLTVPSGSNAMFSVVATGSPPLSYQWFFNGAPLEWQTNSVLSWSNTTANQAGAYGVWITSPYGSITSHLAILTVGESPVISPPPTDQWFLAGSRASLTVGVRGVGPLTFQWQFNGSNLPNNIIATIAGNGTLGFAGDGGLATTGRVNAPFRVAGDKAGNLFIADSGNNRIRKVNPAGIISTVAGTGTPGLLGDGGAATNARLNGCNGIAVDGVGRLFIADTMNNRIRKVETNGVISTVAGGGVGLGDGGAATNAALSNPYAVTLDAIGNLLIADRGNNRIRKVATNGVITTVAGKNGAGFSGDGAAATNANLNSPQDVALDAVGNLFIADSNNRRVRKVDVYGDITTIAGNGSPTFSGDNGAAIAAGLDPSGLSFDPYGELFIAGRSQNRIRRVDPYGTITTVAGTNLAGFSGDGGAPTSARLNNPSGVVLDTYGRILIADTANNRIRRFGQGPTLILENANTNHTGVYRLVVTSPFGSVSSSDISVTVVAAPAITSIRANTDGSVTLNLSSAPNVSSRLYAATNLIPPIVWTPVATNPTGGTWQFTEANASVQAFRFYRSSTP
jgi:sugar lactone lactonase YvrE